MSLGGSAGVRVVLVGGHESGHGADLAPLLDLLPGAVVATAGRPLNDVLSRLLASSDAAVAVLPMTWGRDPVMVSDTARTMRWLTAGAGARRLALCAPFGTVDHLVALLRKAATEAVATRPGAGLVLAAQRADPFDDAELYRVAHLVRTYGAVSEVEVACVAAPPDLLEAVRRARLLGAPEVVVVPAGFGLPPAGVALDGLERTTASGPLLPLGAMAQIVDRRVAAAVHDLGHGRDGIDAGLLADHGHGYAHSHSVEGDAGHHHDHPHAHPHAHGRHDAPMPVPTPSV
jgi:hypothetical protein